MNEKVKDLVPASLRNYFGLIQNRLSNLERRTDIIFAQQKTIALMEETLDTLIARPRYETSDAAGFNGQMPRKRVFRDLLDAFEFEIMVETGTWTGDTTGFLAESARVPVFSSEINYRFHSLARKRLVDFPNVSLHLADSRKFLSMLAADSSLTSRRAFFYLDAHWYTDLPLLEEIQIIANAWTDFVIMVDDFKVPDDDGYGFDDYGPGKTLDIESIMPIMNSEDLVAYFPSASSHDETGYHKRGCVIVAPRKMGTRLNEIASIRKYPAVAV